MGEINYIIQFEKVCKVLELGELLGEPIRITGGFLHRIYKLRTTLGVYAVKALNPQIMQRTGVLENYINSEMISNKVSKYVPALPANIIHDEFIHQIDEQYYIIFDWIDANPLKIEEIRIEHCKMIGSILADIHKIDFNELIGLRKEASQLDSIPWDSLIRKAKEDRLKYVDILLECQEKLYLWDEKAIIASKELEDYIVISHRDLDAKNVIWNQGKPIIIDWESAGFIPPMQDLMETALYWSEREDGTTDEERFLTFMNAYKEKHGDLKEKWRTVLEVGYRGKLEWLVYNLRRSLGIECTDEKDQEMGEEQVTLTLCSLKKYEAKIEIIEGWLKINGF